GAPMKNLAHSASFDSDDKDAPSKPGIKQLVSDNPYLETLYAGGFISEGNHADYTFPTDPHYNPASILDAPKNIVGKPSWKAPATGR
ncbi:hypothetical protein NKH61_33835, partial [Mesorhizobium sp. M1005]